jgi:hypothetical protein
MATFSITTETQKRRHTIFGKHLAIKASDRVPTFYLWYLPSGNQFTRGIGNGYSSSSAAREAARDYALNRLGTRDVRFVS